MSGPRIYHKSDRVLARIDGAWVRAVVISVISPESYVVLANDNRVVMGFTEIMANTNTNRRRNGVT